MIYKYGIISPNLERSCFSSAGQFRRSIQVSLSIIEWPINFNNWKEFLVRLTLQILKIFKLEELTALQFLHNKFSIFHLFSEYQSLITPFCILQFLKLKFWGFTLISFTIYGLRKMTTMGKIVFISNQFPCRFYLYLDQEAWHIV